MIDGRVFKSYQVLVGQTITPEPAPIKEGYTFSGWSEIPKTMPTHDVTVTGSFSINSYNLTYIVDGKVYKSLTIVYGAKIAPEKEPTKEGYTFSGWSEIPESMPAHDVTVTGSFSINSYALLTRWMARFTRHSPCNMVLLLRLNLLQSKKVIPSAAGPAFLLRCLHMM